LTGGRFACVDFLVGLEEGKMKAEAKPLGNKKVV